jgi:hypothetical protein
MVYAGLDGIITTFAVVRELLVHAWMQRDLDPGLNLFADSFSMVQAHSYPAQQESLPA